MTNQQILERAMQKAIDGYEDKYEIDRAGNVWSIKSGRYIKHYIDDKGYPRVGLWGKIDGQWRQKNALVHRLVAQAFIPNPENKPIVHHINGDRLDCHVGNLAWATASENVQDGFDRGRQAWNKDMKAISNMDLHDLARELPRLQELAKALWGEESLATPLGEGIKLTYSDAAWKYHLQRMVIAEDPIMYLSENL